MRNVIQRSGFVVLCMAAFAVPSEAAFQQVWQVGVANGSNSDFVQESGGSNPAPGSATLRDDDWYFAGTYSIGTVLTDERINNDPNTAETEGFERALTAGDHTNRIHFNLPSLYTDPGTEFRLTIPLVSNSVTGGPISFAAFFNEVQIFSGVVDAGTEFFAPTFSAAGVSPTTGENVIRFTRSTANSGWMQFDYVRLEAQPIPEPAAVAIALLAPVVMCMRRR